MVIYKRILLFLTCFSIAELSVAQCTYEYSIYNVYLRKSIKRIKVVTTRNQLNPRLIDEIGCSICLQDQVEVILDNGIKFLTCYKIAKNLKRVLNDALSRNFFIQKVVSYRPQMSRGKTDQNGNRTIFSNHSFGSAVDINPSHNGLYDNCIKWNPSCRLRMGGRWNPEFDLLSIKRNDSLVKDMSKIGLKWGGELVGRQKDFMHFSLHGN